MAERYTPIAYENLFQGMSDKTTNTDEKAPAPRVLVNFDSDGNSAKPRPGSQELFDVGKVVKDVYFHRQIGQTTKMYIFTTNQLFRSEETTPGVWSTPIGIGSYSNGGFVDTAMYTEKYSSATKTGTVVAQESNSIQVGSSITPDAYTGMILRLTSGGITEEFTITGNSTFFIEIDGFIEGVYTSSTYEIYNTFDCLHFTSNGKLYNVGNGLNVTDLLINADFCATYAGRLWISDKNKSSIMFSNTKTRTFPKQQMVNFSAGDGVALGFENYLESLVIIMEQGIYLISGVIPEEFNPVKRTSEDVRVNTSYSFASKNGVMYFLSSRGFESMSRVDTRAQPQARDISFFLDRNRFKSSGLDGYGKMLIYGNKILTQMHEYILVHDTDLSILLESPWFAEYRGFSFRCGQEYDGVLYFGDNESIYKLVEGKTTDANGDLVTCIVEGNVLEYAQRDMQKLFRDVVFYQTWNDDQDASIQLKSWGRGIDPVTEYRDTNLTDEENFDCSMESPYLQWELTMTGDFVLEDIIFFLKPNRGLYAKSHIV